MVMCFLGQLQKPSGLNQQKLLSFAVLIRYFSTAMMFRKLLVLQVLLSSVIFFVGCKSGGSQPSNPFAQNMTIPPPATFSSQESYLGQTPGSFVPQTPASTFQPSELVPSPVQSTPLPPADTSPFSDAANSNVNEGATLFSASGGDAVWMPVEVAATSQTAFQAMDSKVNPMVSSFASGIQTNVPESLVVGTSHVLTSIVDETTPLTEPQTLLYSGRYAE